MAKLVDVAVGVLAEVAAGGWKILITRRPHDAVLGGYWELPGGKLEHGEVARVCLVREFAEEVGLTVEVGAALPKVEHHYEHARVCLHPFFCRRVSGEPRNLAVAEHRWVSPEELASYRFPEANAEIMAHVRYALKQSEPEALGLA